ncbi:MAG: hypothetical protein HGB11_04450 [Chlorobiales bacterium]|nr:hypothetical protein [Chlorobiales bacterium]
MILPTKHLSQERALLTIGARLLKYLGQPRTVSSLWEEFTGSFVTSDKKQSALRYDTYVLTLDLLYLIGAIDFKDGLIIRGEL